MNQFYIGDYRDAYVSCKIHDISRNEEYHLSLYAEYLGVYDVYFPLVQLGIKPDPFRYIGSPFYILQNIIFLGSMCDPILAGDEIALEKVAVLFKQKQIEYNNRFNRPSLA